MGKRKDKKSSNYCKFLKDADMFGHQVGFYFKDDKNKM